MDFSSMNSSSHLISWCNLSASSTSCGEEQSDHTMWRAISFCFHSCNCLLHLVPSATVISHSCLAFSMVCLILQMFVASLYQHCQSWDKSHSVSLTAFTMSLQTFSLAIIHLWCGGINSTGHWRYGTLQLLLWNNEDSILLLSILLKPILMFCSSLVFNSHLHFA